MSKQGTLHAAMMAHPEHHALLSLIIAASDFSVAAVLLDMCVWDRYRPEPTELNSY